MSIQYILNDKGEPVKEPDLMKWAQWLENANREVAKTKVGEALVSTVFLGLDYNFGQGPPVLWETLVFGGPHEDEQDRCSGSREQAEAMHARMIQRISATDRKPNT